MTDTELEQLVDLDLAEFSSRLAGIWAEDLEQVRRHPVVIYIMYRISSAMARSAKATAEEREEGLRSLRRFPASEEYYLAQARIADRRWKFQSQVGRGDELPQEPPARTMSCAAALDIEPGR